MEKAKAHAHINYGKLMEASQQMTTSIEMTNESEFCTLLYN